MEETARQEMVTPILPLPEEGRAENLLFRFCFPPLAQQPAVPKTSIKEQFPQSLCLKRRSVGPSITEALPSSSSLASGQQWIAQEHRSSLFVEPGKGCYTRFPASSRHTPGCHKPQTGFLRLLPNKEESGECYSSHPDPVPCRHRPWAGSLFSTTLPHRGYVGGSAGSAGTVSWSQASAPQSCGGTIRLGYSDSVRPASPLSCMLAKDAIEPAPTAGMKSGFYSPYFILPKKSSGLRPILDLRVLNRALHKLPFMMLTQEAFSGASVP